MLINSENLKTLNTAFNGLFNKGFGSAKSYWRDVAMEAKSSTLTTEYGWLGLFPQIREWLGDRCINGLSASTYRIKNRDFELTIAVQRNDIMDDNVGIYAPMFEEFGRGVAEHPDKLIFALLSGGFGQPCYDGQYFFDTDHPVIPESGGAPVSVSNMQDGAGPAWYLLDTSRAVRPLIYQERMPYQFLAKTNPNDDNVFMQKEYLYGTDGRSNAGYGLWQLAYASKAPLTAENYEAARAAMSALRGDHGHPLGIMPNKLVVPTTLEGPGRRLLNTQLKSQTTTLDNGDAGNVIVNGAGSNEWAGSADLIITPWL